MSDPPQVFVACRLPEEAKAAFSARFPTRFNDRGRSLTPDELIASCADAAVLAVTATDRMDAAMIARLPAGVRVLATYSVGLDHIDLAAARSRSLAVLSTPDVLSESCADVAILLMLGAARRATEGLDLVRSGSWTGWTPLQLLGREMAGHRLGILGMGRIGRAVATRARAFAMPIHYYGRNRLLPELEMGAQFHARLEDLLPNSDFLCVACPASPATKHLLNAAHIARLPRGAVVANISRGDVIDDTALVAALASGEVAAAGLDVFENEPDIHPAYRTLPNVFALPHTGSATLQTRIKMAELLSAGIAALLAGEAPSNQVA